LKYCLNIDKKLIPKTVSLLVYKAVGKSKPFERRGLDEKAVSFINFNFIGVGFVFVFDGVKV